MSKFLSNTALLDIFPHSISHDESIKAGILAIEPELSAGIAHIASLLLYSRLFDEKNISKQAEPVIKRIASLGEYKALEESLLDLLAWQFHVDDYDIAKNYTEKLEMVKASIQIHRKKGTPWAVKRAVEAAISDTKLTLQEWFEENYSVKGQGQPFHFKAQLLVLGDEVLADQIKRAKRIIENTKSLRSHCDGITIAIGSRGCQYYGYCTALANKITIQSELVTELSTEKYNSRQVQAMHTESILSVYPSKENSQKGAKILVTYKK